MSSFLDWFGALLVIVIMATVFLILVGTYKDRDINDEHIQANVYAAKAYFSPHIFLYESEGITYFGVIDRTKFTESHLESNNEYSIPNVGAKFELIEDSTTTTIYNNYEYYDEREAIAEANLRGTRSAIMQVTQYPVQVRDSDGSMTNGLLKITMVVGNK